MIMSINIEASSDKLQHHIKMKVQNKLCIKRKIPQHDKGHTY